MAKSNSELIRELSGLTTTLDERLNNVRRDLERIESSISESHKLVTGTQTALKVLEVRIDGLSQDKKTRSGQHWQVWLAVIASLFALVTSAIPLLLKWVLKV